MLTKPAKEQKIKLSTQKALQIILVISFVGVLFSGFLSYQELFKGGCNVGFVSCGVNTSPILSLPACVYGLVMYTVVFVVAALGLKPKRN